MSNDALFEIGLEELPARFIADAEKQLKEKTAAYLKEERITFETIATFSTPRRLAVLIKGLAIQQASVEEEIKGPAENIAKDANGQWTKAAIGFTKAQGQSVDDIYTKQINGTPYIFVKKHTEGKPTIELLPHFKQIIESITFAQNMRWGENSLKYARPIRWLVAMYGSEVVPFTIAGVSTDRITYGHRFLGRKIELEDPTQYETALSEQYVIADAAKRKQRIVEDIRRLEEHANLQIPLDEELLNEVTNLVEYPTAFLGSFPESFLQLPPEVLRTSMKEHQRYFPVFGHDGELKPRFVGVRNGDDYKLTTVIKGNEKVLHARLSDAQFFYEEDLKHSISHYVQKLDRVVFQEKLGTIQDKTNRVKQLTERIATQVDLSEANEQKAIRAAEICKFDLVTSMVNEFTELQGIMGEIYAVYNGEDESVARAISEHYLPKQADGPLPETDEGALVSIADKIDTITGCISVGLMPTSSQDPYGLRRQAVGILRILEANQWHLPVETLLDIAVDLYRKAAIKPIDEQAVYQDLQDFFKARAAYLLKEMQIEQDIIQALMQKRIGVFSYTITKAKLLSSKRNDETFKPVHEAFIRVFNLAKKADNSPVDEARFITSSEEALYRAFLDVRRAYDISNAQLDAEAALAELEKLADPIHLFFEHNMVMSDNEKHRQNRLALLRDIGELVNDFADLSTIEWKQHF